MVAPRRTYLRPSDVVVLIPAWNEEATIGTTIGSVREQHTGRIIVIANNCTDETAAVARNAGADVLEMAKNEYKKAGALNYALEVLDFADPETTIVLVMDADTTLGDRFIDRGLNEFTKRESVAAVSGVFKGRTSDTLLGYMQSMEYYRYGRELHRYNGNAFVVSGTAAMFRLSALMAVRTARQEGKVLPKGRFVYDVSSLTEDNELTLALKTLGYDCVAPGITCTTDVMESYASLQKQRIRWYRGAIDNLRNYGTQLPGRLRWLYWRQQAGLVLSVVRTFLMLSTLVLVYVFVPFNNRFSLQGLLLLGVAPTILHLCERLYSVWGMGRRARFIAVLYFPDLIYSLTLVWIYTLSVSELLRGKKAAWHHT